MQHCLIAREESENFNVRHIFDIFFLFLRGEEKNKERDKINVVMFGRQNENTQTRKIG